MQTQKKQNASQVNLIDIFFYLLNHWYWFVICIVIAMGYAYWKYSQIAFMYRSNVTVVIKDPANTQSTANLASYNNLINKVSVSNEVLTLKSKHLMENVVKVLDVDVDYTYHQGLRDIELYDYSPVRLSFSREIEPLDHLNAKVTPKDNRTVNLSVQGGANMDVHLGDTIRIDGAAFAIMPTETYGPSWFGKQISVIKTPSLSAAAAFRSRLRVNQNDNSAGILFVTMQDYNLHRANKILSTLIEEYNKDAIHEKNRVAVNTASFINERIAIIQEELGDVENDLARFKTSQKIMSVDEASNRYLNESRGYNSEIVNIETRQSMARYLKEYIAEHEDSYQMIPVNTGINDSNADKAIAQYNEMVLRREKLINASSADSPAVKQVEAQMQILRINITGIIDNLVSSLELRKKELENKENEAIRSFTSMPYKAREMLSIERQQKIKESLYIFLLNKREENALTQAMADNNARMIDDAEGSAVPIYPSKQKMMLMAFLIGLLVPTAFLLIKLFLDTKVRNRKDIEENVSIPFIAEVPFKKAKKKKKGDNSIQLAYDPNSRGLFTESVRILCTDIDIMRPQGVTHTVIAMTSMSTGSGKTFLSSNIAAAMADAKKKVLIMDLDLRKRTVSDVFGLKHHVTGISNYLYDETISLADILRKDIIPGVDIIPAGHIPPNPAELLGRSRFDDVIATLRKEYDYIILDGVPYNAVADLMVINRVVDMTLLILRSGRIDRRDLPVLDEVYSSGKIKNPGIVLNGSEIRHGFGYGYGYGYGEKE